VRSYRTVAPLPFADAKGGLFLWHFPWGRPHWVLPSTLPCGARTFLEGDNTLAAAQFTHAVIV